MKTRILATLAICLLFVAMLFASINVSEPVTAAPPALATPVAVDRGMEPAFLAVLLNTDITGDTRGGCVNTMQHDKLDILYVIDHGTTNTVTLKVQHTNDIPGDSAAYADGMTVVSANAQDATDIQQVQAFGAWTCIYADVTNTNTLGVNVSALVK